MTSEIESTNTSARSPNIKELARKTVLKLKNKKILVLSWFCIIPLLLTGAFLMMQQDSPAQDEGDDPHQPATELDHPVPYVYHLSPGQSYAENCSKCHVTLVPVSVDNCTYCHAADNNITTVIGNVSFPHHDSTEDPLGSCVGASCHDTTDSRYITERVASHDYCAACHDDAMQHERDGSSSSANSAKNDFILFPLLSAPLVTIGLIFFRF